MLKKLTNFSIINLLFNRLDPIISLIKEEILMKKGFKRFLSSVLATVMAVAGMTIGMATTASAATYSYEYIPTNPVVNTNGYFTPGTSYNTTAAALATTSVTNIAGETVTLSRGLKLNSSTTVNFTVTGTADVTVLWSTRLDKTSPTALSIDGGSTAVTDSMDKTAGLQTYTATLNAGSYSIARSGGEGVLYYVRVDETVDGTLSDYKITGTCNLADTTFKVGEYDAVVDASGNWTVTESASAAPFAVGDSLAVSINGYSADPATVTLAGGADDKSFVGGSITFTQLPLSAIPAGTYTYQQVEAGLPNFDVTGITQGLGTGKYRGDIKFILDGTATVTLNGKCGSSDATKSVVVTLGSYLNETIVGGGAVADYTASNVPAGEYTLSMTSDSTSFQLVSITITYGETEVSSETSTEAPTETSTEAPDPVGAITDKATLTASAEFAALTADQESGQFVLLNGLSADGSNKSIDGLGDYTFRFKSNGKTKLTNGVPTNRAIKFTTAGAGTLQVVAMSGSSSTARDYCVYASDGTVIKTVSASGTECVPSELITLPKADTYYIACPSAACNFYSVNVVIGNGVTAATGGSVFADLVDSYAIASVSAADLTYASLDVKVGNYTANTETVFQQVVIDGNLITAAELGTDYIYAVKIAGANGASFDFTTQLNAQ